MNCRPVDYGLIYRLEDERFVKELAYICPFWDWIRDFADRFRQESWWDVIPESPLNGEVRCWDDLGFHECTPCNECHGEWDDGRDGISDHP